MALITQADVENALHLADDALDGTDVALWISQAQAIAEAWCRQELEYAAAVTDTFEVDGWDPWWELDRFPVTAITSVTVDDTALTSTEYRLYPADGRIRRLSAGIEQTWSRWVDGNVVVYSAGYGSGAPSPYDTVPPNMVLGIAQIAGILRTASPSTPGAVKQVSLDGSDSITYAVKDGESEILMPQSVKMLLGPWRKVIT